MGPPGAGKTTLRKVFFEGESSKVLLEYALEPTHGQESIVLDFKEKIGIFDLAGQENDVWLQKDENSMFLGARIIIIVVDSRAPFEDNLAFIKQIISLRDDLVPDGMIFLLNHKIDLLKDQELNDLYYLMSDRLYDVKLIDISFTSIQRKYFSRTFSLFTEILKTCVSMKVASGKSDVNFMKETIFFLYYINESNVITREELIYKLQVSEHEFYRIESLLIKDTFIRINKIGPSSIYHLTEKGISYISKLFKNFSTEEFKKIPQKNIITKKKELGKDYRFLGFFITNRHGVPLLRAEIVEDFFENFLESEEDGSISPDLIPMFISALEMFSSQINIKDLSGIKFKGSNIKVQTFSFDMITVSLFVNSNINLKPMETYIIEYFDSMLKKYQADIMKANNSGDLGRLSVFAKEGTEWLKEMNTKYNALADNHDIFDQNETKTLFEILDKIPENSISDSQMSIIRKLKNELIKTSIEEDLCSLKELSNKIKKL